MGIQSSITNIIRKNDMSSALPPLKNQSLYYTIKTIYLRLKIAILYIKEKDRSSMKRSFDK